jgi:hypothetical protein
MARSPEVDSRAHPCALPHAALRNMNTPKQAGDLLPETAGFPTPARGDVWPNPPRAIASYPTCCVPQGKFTKILYFSLTAWSAEGCTERLRTFHRLQHPNIIITRAGRPFKYPTIWYLLTTGIQPVDNLSPASRPAGGARPLPGRAPRECPSREAVPCGGETFDARESA